MYIVHIHVGSRIKVKPIQQLPTESDSNKYVRTAEKNHRFTVCNSIEHIRRKKHEENKWHYIFP